VPPLRRLCGDVLRLTHARAFRGRINPSCPDRARVC
jgi:hypothetical protein